MESHQRIFLPFRRDERSPSSSSSSSADDVDAREPASHDLRNARNHRSVNDDRNRLPETDRETEARVAFTSPPRGREHNNAVRQPPVVNVSDLQNALREAPAPSLQQQQQQQRTDANTQRQFQQQPSQFQLPPQQRGSHYREELARLIEEQSAHLNRTPSNDGGRSEEDEDDEEEDEDDEDEADGEFIDGSEQVTQPQQHAAAAGGRQQLLGGASPRQATQDEPPPQQQLMDLSAEEYEPTEQEIQEYCEWLGLDMATDKCLVWIAREALRAPLPENWTMCYTDEREVYYFNVRTGESIWDHPMDAYYKSLYKEEKAKLDKKRKRSRSFRGSLPVKPLAEFFSELSETCGVGAIVLMDDEHDETSEEQAVNSSSLLQPAPPPWNDVPDALIDPIDFRVFLDPVVLPTSGRTVSRHTIINNTWRDPFTREYCENRRLVPNVDKRSEVDRWLQSMVQAFVQRMTGGTLSGLQRLAAILPFLLDRDEEACVRGQTLVLGWLLRQVDHDKKYDIALQQAVEAAAKQAECQTLEQPPPPPKVSPREGGAHRGLVTTKRQSISSSSAVGPGKPSLRAGGSSLVSKSLEALPLQKSTTVAPRSASVVPVCPASPPPTSAVSFPPRRRVLRDLFEHLPDEDVEQILLSLMTMFTSASREALLLLATYVPQIMQRTSVFGTFDDDVRFVLRIAKKDIAELVQAADDGVAKLCRDQHQQQKLPSGSVSSSSQPFPQQNVLASPVSTRDAIDSPLVGIRSFPAGSQPSSLPLPAGATNRTTSGLHDTMSDLRRVRSGLVDDDDDDIDAPMPIDFLSTLRVHAVTESEKKLSLRWLMLLHTTPCEMLPEEAPQIFAALDVPAVNRLVLCCYASKLLLPPAPQAQVQQVNAALTIRDEFGDSSALISMLPRSQAWPQQINALPDATLRSLIEVCAMGTDDAAAQVRLLFDLLLHGSERCMDVVVRHSADIKASVLRVLQDPSQHCDTHETKNNAVVGCASRDEAAIASSPADLLAAILIFHDLASLEEVASACSSRPTVALKVAYNLTPRLARSQWRPKHFHQTITAFASLVEEHREEAWRVIDRAGLHFFLRELSKKKNTAADVRVKIEALEASERQLEQSMTLARWGKFAKCLEHKRAVELERELGTRRILKRAKCNTTKPVTVPPVTLPTTTTTSASPRGSIKQTLTLGANSNAVKGTVQKQPSPRTVLPKLSPRSASVVVTLDTPPPADQALNIVEHRCAALVAAAQIEAEQASRKQSEIVAQRASLLSQALVMLITVRLKPKQHRSGGATAAAVALQLQQQQQHQIQGNDSPGMGKASAAAAASAATFVKSPPATRKAPAEIVMQHGVSSSRSSLQATPRQQPESSDSINYGGAPPPAPAALPTLRTLRTPGGGSGTAGLSTPPQPQSLPLSSRRQMQQASIIGTAGGASALSDQHPFQQHQRATSTVAGLSGTSSFLPPIS
jgi:hypothetical protein